MDLNEKDWEIIGRCAEQNAPDCGFNQGNLCQHCSVWKCQQVAPKLTTRKDGLVELLMEVKCLKCPTRLVFVFDVNEYLLRTQYLPFIGWTQDKKNFWICPDCSQIDREVEVLGQAMLKIDS